MSNSNAYDRSVVANRAMSDDRRRSALFSLGGMADHWPTSYPLTTYHYPVDAGDGRRVPLDTPQRVRNWHEHGIVEEGAQT